MIEANEPVEDSLLLLRRDTLVLRKKQFRSPPADKPPDCTAAQLVSSANVLRTALALLAVLRLLRLMFWSRTQLAAEHLFLRKQLACYVEREVRPRGCFASSGV